MLFVEMILLVVDRMNWMRRWHRRDGGGKIEQIRVGIPKRAWRGYKRGMINISIYIYIYMRSPPSIECVERESTNLIRMDSGENSPGRR